MSEKRGITRELLANAFQKLLQGPLGEEVCVELEREYLERRDTSGSLRATLWYAGHLFVPSTWALALKLRRRAKAVRREGNRRCTGSADARAPRRRTGSFGLHGSLLDVKLGLRMLLKYPGLTLLGGLGIAVVIAIGAGWSVMLSAMYSKLPVEEPDRVVKIRTWDAEINRPERQVLHDFVIWREELKSIEDLGAYRTTGRNLIIPGGHSGDVTVAQMTASGFRVTRVPPLLGRHLVDEDELETSPPVAVIGYDVWQARFGADSNVVGRDVRLGNTVRTVVGVMPKDYAFPVYHDVWVPLQYSPTRWIRREGPGIDVFGRLAPGYRMADAQAELTTYGRQAATAFPSTHELLRPRVSLYTRSNGFVEDMGGTGGIIATQLIVVLLVVLVCLNVAILVYARTATRYGEIAVRSALGASRARIVGQLFVEGFVLSSLSALVGLWAIAFALSHIDAILAAQGALPYWISFDFSGDTILTAMTLAILGAIIVGIIPALQATGRKVPSSLQRLGGGATGIQLGKTWTALVITQVALAVAILPGATSAVRQWAHEATAEPGFATEQFLTTLVRMDHDPPPSGELEAFNRQFHSQFLALNREFMSRLKAEPNILDVAFAWRVPGEEWRVFIEVEGLETPTSRHPALKSGLPGHSVRFNRVTPGIFDAFDVPLVTGRLFNTADLDSSSFAVIVNNAFVRRFSNRSDVLGDRFRYVGRGGDAEEEDMEYGKWFEIVGVVGDFPNPMGPWLPSAKIYHPMSPGQIYPTYAVVRVAGGDPLSYAGRFRDLAAAVDPTLRLTYIRVMEEVLGELKVGMRMVALTFGAFTLSVLLLSSAGIYALMSVTVTRRRREIGIRSALGGAPRQILRTIFIRSMCQVIIGIILGTLAAFGMDQFEPTLIVAVAVLVLGVGLIATIGPARRGLRIQPTEALRAE